MLVVLPSVVVVLVVMRSIAEVLPVVIIPAMIAAVTATGQGCRGSGKKQERQSVSCKFFHGTSPVGWFHGSQITGRQLNES